MPVSEKIQFVMSAVLAFLQEMVDLATLVPQEAGCPAVGVLSSEGI